MTGRGIGRGVGRGVPRSEPTPEPAPVPDPAAIPADNVVPPVASTAAGSARAFFAGVGRGRGVALTSATVPSQPPVVPTESSLPDVAPAVVPSVVSAGRGIIGRGRRLGLSASAQTADVPSPENWATGTGLTSPPVVGAATHEQPVDLAERMKALQTENKPVAGLPTSDRTSGDAGQGPLQSATAAVGEGRPGAAGARPTDIPQGAEGARLERERREAELQFKPKPKGQLGRKVDLVGNVVHFDAEPTAMVYEYRVDFYPQTWSSRLRPKLISKIEQNFPGPYLFDFENLFLAVKLPNEEQDYFVDSPFNADQKYKLTVRRVMQNRANESKELMNLIVRELEMGLKFVQIGRNRYDPTKRVVLRQGNMPELEIWPGFQTSVNPFSGGILLMTDPAFRVVRVGNVKISLDQWKREARSNNDQFQRLVRDNLIGSTVLTPYNDKSYTVSEIKWDQTPASTFPTREGEITYVEYYKKHHNIDIKDMQQPLLFSKPAPTGVRRRENRIIALIPELCQLTGIQDDLRANFNAMKAITTTTKLNPNVRFDYIMEYLDKLKSTDIGKALMDSWGIKISSELLRFGGRVLPPVNLQFGGSRGPVTAPDNGDWTRNATGQAGILGCMPLRNWAIIFQRQNQSIAEDFDRMLRQVGQQLGMTVAEPEPLMLNADTNVTYVDIIKKAVTAHKVEMVVLIFPTPRDDRYAAVKKACYITHGIASQCINLRTLSKPDRMRAIVQKIALQMNCKLGGYLWRMGNLQIPLRKGDVEMRLMVVGIDAYHDLKRQRESVTAMVASTDDSFTHWHSRCNFQSPKSEVGAGLKVSFTSALTAYAKRSKFLPNTIVVFRDGLSDDELDKAVNSELPQLQDSCNDPTVTQLLTQNAASSLDVANSSSSSSSSSSEYDYSPEIYYIVVQKRINQRLFLVEKTGGKEQLSNPKPGTVCDEVITRRDMYDFYLVPQNVREGSVTPVHFVVVHQPEDPRLSVDSIQGLAYKLTHMYYNWTGTIKVPAPCMYAHKLAYQSGACYDRMEPKMDIVDKLFFL